MFRHGATCVCAACEKNLIFDLEYYTNCHKFVDKAKYLWYIINIYVDKFYKNSDDFVQYNERENHAMYKGFLKRFFDIVLSLIGITVAAIPMLIIVIAIKIDSKGPVIFKQERVGKKGKVFKIYKFRSMCVGAEKMGSGVYSGKGDARITKVGKFLRATSLDEIPQFFNLLKGDMSLVGPRPPLTYHPWPWDEYTEEQRRMFEVRPGITGWAQVNGRKEVEWNRRIQLNVWYVDHVSLWLDIKILFMTVFKVFSNADNENSGATVIAMPSDEVSNVNIADSSVAEKESAADAELKEV